MHGEFLPPMQVKTIFTTLIADQYPHRTARLQELQVTVGCIALYTYSQRVIERSGNMIRNYLVAAENNHLALRVFGQPIFQTRDQTLIFTLLLE